MTSPSSIKFRSSEDAQMFLLELGRVDLIKEVKDAAYVPPEELLTEFITRRRALIPKLKDFRRSQGGKEAWRKNRAQYMKGIKRYHDSTQGKRFHRSLSRFLATRDFRSGDYKREGFESYSLTDVYEVLKALASLKTHALIELDYYHGLDEEVDIHLLVEEVLASVSRVEAGLTAAQEGVSGDDLDFLIRLTDTNVLTEELGPKAPALWAQYVIGKDMFQTGAYLDALNWVKAQMVS